MSRMQLLQALAGHMRVNRRGRYVGVAEEHLHDAQAGLAVVKRGLTV